MTYAAGHGAVDPCALGAGHRLYTAQASGLRPGGTGRVRDGEGSRGLDPGRPEFCQEAQELNCPLFLHPLQLALAPGMILVWSCLWDTSSSSGSDRALEVGDCAWEIQMLMLLFVDLDRSDTSAFMAATFSRSWAWIRAAASPNFCNRLLKQRRQV